MEQNKKTELDKLKTQTIKDSPLKTTEGPAFNDPTGAPNKTDTPAAKSGGATPPPPSGETKTTASRNLQKFKYNNRRSASAK